MSKKGLFILVVGVLIVGFVVRYVLIETVHLMPASAAKLCLYIISPEDRDHAKSPVFLNLVKGQRNEVLRWMLSEGLVDKKLLHIQTKVGFTVMHFADLIDKDLAREFLTLGADPNADSRLGWKPLHYIMQRSRAGYMSDELKLLLEFGADINATDRRGNTPLHYACQYANNPEIVREMLVAGADVNATNNFGETPLWYCTGPYRLNGETNTGIQQLLLDSGADSSIRPTHGLYKGLTIAEAEKLEELDSSNE